MKNNENILDLIFNARSEELAKLTKEDREFLDSPEVDFDKTYKVFINSLETFTEEQRNAIIENLNICIDTKDLIHAYFYKKYYKMGFSECMKLIINCNNF